MRAPVLLLEITITPRRPVSFEAVDSGFTRRVKKERVVGEELNVADVEGGEPENLTVDGVSGVSETISGDDHVVGKAAY